MLPFVELINTFIDVLASWKVFRLTITTRNSVPSGGCNRQIA